MHSPGTAAVTLAAAEPPIEDQELKTEIRVKFSGT